MRKILGVNRVVNFVDSLFGTVLHAKQVASMGNAVAGLLYAPRLSSTSIGRTLARLKGGIPKHGIKQVSRMLGNENIVFKQLSLSFIRWVIGVRDEIIVTIDWTGYGGDAQSSIVLSLITSHGRATPLLWKTYHDTELLHSRSCYERRLLRQFKTMVPSGTHVIVLADRGFASTRLYHCITRELGWDYIIRFKQNVMVMTEAGTQVPMGALVVYNGRIIEMANAVLTKNAVSIPAIVYTKCKGMKKAWCLATSIVGQKERVVALYSRRFTCEEHFRDEKDDRFGLGFDETRVTTCERRDRMLLIAALATILLTLLGAVGEYVGYDRRLRANTVRKRTHSYFRQGREYVNGVAHQYLQQFGKQFEKMVRMYHLNTKPVYAI